MGTKHTKYEVVGTNGESFWIFATDLENAYAHPGVLAIGRGLGVVVEAGTLPTTPAARRKALAKLGVQS